MSERRHTSTRRRMLKKAALTGLVGSAGVTASTGQAAAMNDCYDNYKSSSDSYYYASRNWDGEVRTDLGTYACRQWAESETNIKAYVDGSVDTYGVDYYDDDEASYIQLTSQIEFYGDTVNFDTKVPEYEYTGKTVSLTTEEYDTSHVEHSMNDVDATVDSPDYTAVTTMAYVEKDGTSATFDARAVNDRYYE